MDTGEPREAVRGPWAPAAHTGFSWEGPAQDHLCEQLLSWKDLSNRPVEAPAGLGALLQEHQCTEVAASTPTLQTVTCRLAEP